MEDTTSKDEPKFSQEQYDMLLRCSEKEDMTDWNDWRKENPEEKIFLEGAELRDANLERARLTYSHLNGANLRHAHLEGARIWYAHLQHAQFRNTLVDGTTSLVGCEVDRETDFRNVALESVQIDPGIKALLKYNVRRMNWEEWYRNHRLQSLLVRPFWWVWY